MIYEVRATFEDRSPLLGIAEGNIVDIEAYFDDIKGYHLEITPYVPPQIIKIPTGYASLKKKLLDKQAELQKEIDRLNNV